MVCFLGEGGYGGEWVLTAICTNVSNAQKAEFAKFGPFPESGLSCRLRRKPGESPVCRMLQEARVSGMRRKADFAKWTAHTAVTSPSA